MEAAEEGPEERAGHGNRCGGVQEGPGEESSSKSQYGGVAVEASLFKR